MCVISTNLGQIPPTYSACWLRHTTCSGLAAQEGPSGAQEWPVGGSLGLQGQGEAFMGVPIETAALLGTVTHVDPSRRHQIAVSY